MKRITISKAYEKLGPESCVFVLSVDKKRKPSGMICSWHMKCSETPPLFAVSLWKQGNTQKLIKESKEFVIAVANKELEKEVRIFGYTSGASVNKFEKTKIKTVPSKYIKTPLLKEATINFECRLEKTVDAGECYVFIGKIVNAYAQNKKILFSYKKKGKHAFNDIENC